MFGCVCVWCGGEGETGLRDSSCYVNWTGQIKDYCTYSKTLTCQDLRFGKLFPSLPHCATAPSGPKPPHYRGFTITLRHSTLGRTPLDEWSARRRDLYLTTHNTHNRQTSIPLAKFEPTIPESERPQTHALARSATGVGRFASNAWVIKM